jgi:hypothetical protein
MRESVSNAARKKLRAHIMLDYAIDATPPVTAGHKCNGVRPPQTRSPAMISQGFTVLPLEVAFFRHVTVTYAGLSLPAFG